MDKIKHIYRLYYQLARMQWGHGYATEIASALVEYILNEYPNAIIKAEAVKDNPASSVVLKKIGLKQTHVEEKGFKRNDLELDLIHYSNV